MIRLYFICLTLLMILALPVSMAIADEQKEEMTAPTPGEIKGLWMIGDGSKIVKIDECRDMLCGNVVWLERTDSASFAQDPLCGKQVFYGFKLSPSAENKWHNGQIFMEEEGAYVDADIVMTGKNALKVKTSKRGAGILNHLPFVRDTREWTRVDGSDYTYCGSAAAGMY